MLLVISAYGYMARQVIPALVNQLESALGVAIGNERGVSPSPISVCASFEPSWLGVCF